jgi:ABC-type multidrug transport system ATPase subunit
MNESTLSALMRLFAICCKADEEYGNATVKRNIVMDYLDRHYSKDTVIQYITFYDEQVYNYQRNIGMASDYVLIDKQAKARDRIIVQCNNINHELEHEQKIIVLIYLLDFINSSNNLSKEELDLVWSIAINLKIKDDEFLDLKSFTFQTPAKVVHLDRLFVIHPGDLNLEPGIKHSTLEKLAGNIFVLHIPSSDTYVFRYFGNLVLQLNGQLITPARSHVWAAGSVIRNPVIGYLYYNWIVSQFKNGGLKRNFVMSVKDIIFHHRNSANGIKQITLTEESGRLVAIMGSSGSGKTTLLNLLNGNLKPQQGTIEINGWDLHQHKNNLKGAIGYVPQDDVLIKELTTYQNLYYSAKLSFGDHTPAQIKMVVECALVDFDLVEARDLHVGDAESTILSGGQRKRLNIAMELIREPSILLVDEPTSGLSSADAEKVIVLLKNQTYKGKLVIINIHQPSSDTYKMFDKLLVLDQGGRVIYYGHPESAISYFKTEASHVGAHETECLCCGNIDADLIIKIAERRVVDNHGRLTRKRKISPEEWHEKYLSRIYAQAKSNGQEHDSSIPSYDFKTPDRFHQFLMFFQRDVLSKYYNSQYLILLIVEAPVLALMLAYFSKKFTFVNGAPHYTLGENEVFPAFLFMAVIVALFLGLVISAEEIFRDRKILVREKFLNLSRFSYLSSKILVLFIISGFQSLVFLLISNAILDIQGMLFPNWLILFSASCWANLVGLNISSGFKSVIAIYVVVPLILVPQLIFSGVVIDFADMHNKGTHEKTVPLIGDLMASRWAYEAIAVAQFKDNPFEKHLYEPEATAKNANFYRSFAIPELIEITQDITTPRKERIDTLAYLNKLSVLRSEIQKISVDIGQDIPAFADSLYPERMDHSLRTAVINFLNRAEMIYKHRYILAVEDRDRIYNELIAAHGNVDELIRFKQQYHNKRLASLINKENSIQNFTMHHGELIPLKDAIYRKPEEGRMRAHFYAPVKFFFRQEMDTFWFNLSFIWLFSMVLFVLLYYDFLRRALTLLETLPVKRGYKIRFVLFHK